MKTILVILCLVVLAWAENGDIENNEAMALEKDLDHEDETELQIRASSRYVSGIRFTVSNYPISSGHKMIRVDMNKGSGGKFIYPVIQYSNDGGDAIRGLAFIQNNQVTPHGYTKINQDLNEGAGGTYNYLCFSKNGSNKMTAITFIAKNHAISANTRDGYHVYKQDLNTGARRVGAYVYLLYKTNTGKPF